MVLKKIVLKIVGQNNIELKNIVGQNNFVLKKMWVDIFFRAEQIFGLNKFLGPTKFVLKFFGVLKKFC